ncbi:hypothetical protein F2Q69_00013518 [Brassica cretica]|uniref:Uncharacterized protein n=1 Tax=Brassica cretica TaxID=69181 RepID=A0A8S9R544_BRACR|nr:hypothetical protein F2Q69_00013518 [Brassica cretica]
MVWKQSDEIRFTAKEQEKILAPHHDALVISLTVANCLVKRILVDNGSSSNIISQMAYQDLGLEENTLTCKVTPLIGFSSEVKQTAGEVFLPVYAEGGPEVKDNRNWGSFQRSRTLDHSKNPRNPRRTYVDRSAWSPPKPFKVASARKTWSSQDPRPPPHIDKITKNLTRYQPVISRISKWDMSTPRRLPHRMHQTSLEQRVPRRHRIEKLSQAGDLRTWSLQWMNVTTRFMEVHKIIISRKQWSSNIEGRGMKRVSTTVPRPKKEVQETFDTGQPLMISGMTTKKQNGKQHAARELDSDQLPRGRIRYPTGTGSGLT